MISSIIVLHMKFHYFLYFAINHSNVCNTIKFKESLVFSTINIYSFTHCYIFVYATHKKIMSQILHFYIPTSVKNSLICRLIIYHPI